MDYSTQKLFWNLLQKEKAGRTILLTTQFVNEADIFSDRIGILLEGILHSYGPPHFLQQQLGSDYHLSCTKKSDCDPNAVTKALQDFIPDIKMHNNLAGKLSYTLPAKDIAKFEKMFRKLENDQRYLKIDDLHVRLIPLEEIIFKIASGSEQQLENVTFCEFDNFAGTTVPLLSGYRLHLNQWLAMLLKRYHCWTKRCLKDLLRALFSVIIIAILVLVFHLIVDRPPKMKLQLNHFDKTVTMLQTPESFENPQIKQ